MNKPTRRQFLAIGASGMVGSLAGCANIEEPGFLQNTRTRTFEPPYKWRASSSADHEISAMTRPTDGTIFFGDSDLHAVNTATGNEYWRHDGWGPPAVHGETVYTLDRSGTNGVVALATDTGDQQWKSPHGDSISVEPVVAAQTLFYPDGAGTLFALSTADGAKQWAFQTGGEIRGIAATDNTVVIGNAVGNVIALDIASGEPRWNHLSNTPVSAGPTVSGETVYVGGETGTLRAAALQSGEIQWEQPLEYTVTGVTEHAGTVFVTEAGDEDGHLYALNADTGEERYRLPELPARAPPAVTDRAVYLGTHHPEQPSYLYAFDRNSGDTLAQLELVGNVVDQPVVAAETVYVATGLNLEAIVKTEFFEPE